MTTLFDHHLLKTPPRCPRCDGGEDHPERPYGDFSDRADACHCGGAGRPCPDCCGSSGF